jgi:superfamily II DNA or RNA helicase
VSLKADEFVNPIERLIGSADARVQGDRFELLCRYVLGSAPEFARQFRNVWLWRDWPGQDGHEIGIDLVAETVDGDLWAIQAKGYGPEVPLRWGEVANFLAAAPTTRFAHRLLFASTNHLTGNARRGMHQSEAVSYWLLADLLASVERWPESIGELRPVPPPPLEARPHQLAALGDVVGGFSGSERGQLIMACGTGKTLVGLLAHEHLEARRTLVLVPTLTLLRQVLHEWARSARAAFVPLCVCSDAKIADPDSFVHSVSELPADATTEADRVAAFLMRPGARVLFGTYQSSEVAGEAARRVGVQFDLVIADEAHRCAGRNAGPFAAVLDDGRIPARKRLFMTATPRWTPKVSGADADEVASMDDPVRFGREFHRLPFSRARQQRLLAEYRVVVLGVLDSDVQAMVERRTLVSRYGEEALDAAVLAAEVALLRAFRDYDLQRVISFHRTIDRSKSFAGSLVETLSWLPEQLRPLGEIRAEHIDGTMQTRLRTVKLRLLAEASRKRRVLVANARCLTEGIDVPTLDGIAFIDPRRSQIDVVQAVGRVMRAPQGVVGKVGTVVLPVVVGEDDDPDTVLRSSAFKHVWQVVRALRDHDDDLAEQFDAIRREYGRTGTYRLPDKLVIDLPVAVGRRFAEALELRVIEVGSQSWEFWFGLLERFVAREQHAHVPQKHLEDGHPLGTWVNKQRIAFHGRVLEADREARLQTLPGWIWSSAAAAWEEGFRLLERFVAREGHADIPSAHVEDGYRLGRWVGRQRGWYRARKLDPQWVTRLEELPGWEWDALEAAWDKGFAHLEHFVARNEHASVRFHYFEGDYPLGRWVAKQRLAFSDRRLPPYRAARLEELPGWTWGAFDAAWEQGFAYLELFVAREGHARVQSRQDEDGYRLGQWVVSQRASYRDETLDPERITRLEALPGWTWNALEAAWDDGFAHLKRFVEHEKHARVPDNYVEDSYRLGQWVRVQRASYRKGKLDSERITRLEALPCWTWRASGR